MGSNHFLFLQAQKELVDPYAVVGFAGHKVYIHMVDFRGRKARQCPSKCDFFPSKLELTIQVFGVLLMKLLAVLIFM